MRARGVGRAVAPWVRTRLRTAPGGAAALAVLVLLTACLAAAFPRAVDTYEDDGLRSAVASAGPDRSALRVSAPPPGVLTAPAERDRILRPASLAGLDRDVRARIPAELAVDRAQSSYGFHTTEPLETLDSWLPRPYGLPAKVTVTDQSDLARHAKVVAGRLPRTNGQVSAATREVEAAVTPETAKSLHIEVGSVVHSQAVPSGTVAFRITGFVRPLRPSGSYWSVNPVLRTPELDLKPGNDPVPPKFWQGGLLLAPGAAPVLQSTPGNPELYWNLAPVSTHLTARRLAALTSAVAYVEGGPGLLKLRDTVDDATEASTDLDDILHAYTLTRSTIGPVIAVAAFGTGTVAAVVLLMAGGLATSRRRAELSLLRSRGASLRGIAGRLCAETAVVALPAAALGLGVAVLALPDARLWPALTGAGAVAVAACLTLPLRAVVAHRRPQLNAGRDDVVRARPSRRRTVAELTLLVLAVGAVVALRRRGTGGADELVSAAPVLVGVVAALVLVRLYPLPLRLLAGPAGRLRGPVGFLSLARAGRSSAGGALPLLALLTALTTAAFGGSVLAGIAHARDQAALLSTGADARVTGEGLLPDGLAAKVAAVPGVRSVAPVRIEYDVAVPGDGKPVPVLGVTPDAYAALARSTGIGPFRADLLKRPDRSAPLPVIVSPGTAARLGTRPRELVVAGYHITVRVAAVDRRTPVLPDGDFMVLDLAGLGRRVPTTLMVSGPSLDAKALRSVVRTAQEQAYVQVRTEVRAKYSDSPMQSGASRIYRAAVGAGAGYAALALLLSLLRTAPERAALLARLRTMGLTRGQGRRLLVLEALPHALLAAAGGALTGWASVRLLAAGVDLSGLALASDGASAAGGVQLRADVWSLVLPAAGVVLLAAGVAASQAWWTGRKGSISELRAGDAR
ncbi:ABC transporter permease [Streptomyces sp. NBC_01500]|uniref:ABC transporter permease n=1 Tax=Streptomyces sp. NBC_01500 TaxID=2903886 RepID=UPI0022549282|nr:ABC transporter permease [Streptomyces sp. NBC_01500]MCX4551056.1 ABC transporter permease [Streptomyces sp. NBC_01500]